MCSPGHRSYAAYAETAKWIAEAVADIGRGPIRFRISTFAWYLAPTMLQKDDNNLVVTVRITAVGNVRWLEGQWNGKLEDVRNIPFLETCLYVQRVLVYAWYVRIYVNVAPRHRIAGTVGLVP